LVIEIIDLRVSGIEIADLGVSGIEITDLGVRGIEILRMDEGPTHGILIVSLNPKVAYQNPHRHIKRWQ